MRLATYKNVRFPNLSVRVMRDLLIAADLDWMRAFRESGIRPSAAELPGGSVSGPQELAFQRAFVGLTAHRRELWVELGLHYRQTMFRAYGLAMVTAPTIQEWARVGSDHSDVIYSMAQIRVVERGGIVVGYILDYSETPADLLELSVHRDLAAMDSMLDELWRGEFPYTKIGVPLPQLHPRLVERITAPLEFNAAGLRIEWSPESAIQRLPQADDLQYETFLAESRRIIAQFGISQDWTASVMTALTRSSPMAVQLEAIAASLNVSERTLQRRLKSANLTFREVLDRARAEVAKDALANSNISVAALAQRLGYTERTAFTAAFHRWAGCSPSQFRSDPSRAS